MGKGNKSVGQVHSIIKHMNNLGGNPEIKYDPISHDEKGIGRGGHLGKSPFHLEDEKKNKVKIKKIKLDGVTVTGGRGSGKQATNQWTNTRTGHQEFVKPEDVKPWHKKAGK
jgi:hypothetical protein